ncbi:MAG: translocation/assembly module TamB domain-containing protein, partial [Geminicoccales bacterium]
LDASFTPQDARQNVRLSLAARDLAGDFGSLSRLEANASVADALGAARLEASATAREFRQNDLNVAQLRLNVAGTPEQLTVSSTVEGQMMEPFALDARAQLALGEAVRLRLEQLTGQVADKPLRLVGPAEVTVGDEMRLSGLNLELAGARLRADASIGTEVAVEATLEDLSLALLADFGAPALTGQANAKLQMSGPVGNPGGTALVTVTGLRSPDPAFADLPPARLTANAALAQRRLSVDLRGEGVSDRPVVLTAALPVVLQLEPFRFELPDGPLDGRLDAELQLARLADIAGLDGDRLEGRLGAALSLAGTSTDPQLNGTVSIADGIYENGTTGTVLHDLTLRARARQQRLTIEAFSANDGGSGRLSGEGTVELDPAASFPVDLRLALRR